MFRCQHTSLRAHIKLRHVSVLAHQLRRAQVAKSNTNCHSPAVLTSLLAERQSTTIQKLDLQSHTMCFLSSGAAAPVGQGLLITEASRSHSDTPQSVGLLRTSDQPDAETSTWQHKHSQETDIHAPAGFEPAIPAIERPQTHALDR
jgi:hypothetical protein